MKTVGTANDTAAAAARRRQQQQRMTSMDDTFEQLSGFLIELRSKHCVQE
jgi:hypothetical protein